MIKYMKADLYRLFSSSQFWFGVLGIALLYILGAYQAVIVSNVYIAYFYNGWFSTVIMAYAFCAVSFAGCFVEDCEQGFWVQAVQRGNIYVYTWSKALVCFFSGVLTMVCGILLFALITNIWLPWVPDETFLQAQRTTDTFGILLKEQTILVYFACSAVKSGMLGGIFALLSAYVSLYEKNRLFTICAPVAGYYFIENLLISNMKLPSYFDLLMIYGQGYSLFSNKIWDIFYAIFVSGIVLTVLGWMISKKVRSEISGTNSH